MAQLKTHKFVAALPPVLEADAIYFVRSGVGYDQYVTNHSGTIVAYPSNSAPIDSPAFTGAPTAPTPSSGDSSTKIATTAFLLKGFGGFFSGKPAASQIIGASVVQGGYLLSNTVSDFSVVTAATTSTVFTIKRNRTTDIGTITFSAGANYGIWNLTSPSVADNDFITIHAPATPDATLADGAFIVRAV